jgi:ABC-2 type transport system ATP-binding protein
VPARERVAFVAQDAPLYPGLSIKDTVRLARQLNRSWDQQRIEASLAELELPLRHKVGRLLPGQRARLALAVALAKRPELVVLDEPVSRLDPLARHEFSTALMTAVADDGLSVLLTSHVVAELPAIADYLVVLAVGRVAVAGEVADLLAGHRMLTGPAEQADELTRRLPVVAVRGAARQAHLLVRAAGPFPPGWQVREVGLDELVLSYLRAPDARWLPGPAAMERIA